MNLLSDNMPHAKPFHCQTNHLQTFKQAQMTIVNHAHMTRSKTIDLIDDCITSLVVGGGGGT